MYLPKLWCVEFFSPNFSGEEVRDTPYQVEITVPVVGYEPIQFTLTKMCGKSSLSLKESTQAITGGSVNSSHGFYYVSFIVLQGQKDVESIPWQALEFFFDEVYES